MSPAAGISFPLMRLTSLGGRFCRRWIETVTGEKLQGETIIEGLKSGVALCKLVNALKPGTIPKINKMKQAFFQVSWESLPDFAPPANRRCRLRVCADGEHRQRSAGPSRTRHAGPRAFCHC